MTASAEPVELTLLIQPGADATPDEVDQLTRQLLAELLETDDVAAAQLAAGGPAPAGAKVGDPVTLGAIALAVLPSLLPKVVEFVQSWSQRGQGRAVKFKGTVAGQVVEFEGTAQDLKAVLAALTGQPPQPAPKPSA